MIGSILLTRNFSCGWNEQTLRLTDLSVLKQKRLKPFSKFRSSKAPQLIDLKKLTAELAGSSFQTWTHYFKRLRRLGLPVSSTIARQRRDKYMVQERFLNQHNELGGYLININKGKAALWKPVKCGRDLPFRGQGEKRISLKLTTLDCVLYLRVDLAKHTITLSIYE